MRWMLMLFSAVLLMFAGVQATRAEAAEGFQRLYPAVQYYLHDAAGGGFQVAVDLKDRGLFPGPAEMMVRIEGPDGRVLVRDEMSLPGTSGLYPSFVNELDYYEQGVRRGVPPMVRWSSLSEGLDRLTTQHATYLVPDAGPGVYRVFLVGREGHFARVETSRPMPRGVLADPNWLHGADRQAHTRYVYVTPGTQAFNLLLMELDRPRTRSLRVLTEDGKVLVDMPAERDGGRLIRYAEMPAKAYAAGEDHTSSYGSAQVHRNENDYSVSNFPFRHPGRSLDGQVLRLEFGAGEGDYLLTFVLDHETVKRPPAWSAPLGDGAMGPTAVYADSAEAARAIAGGSLRADDGAVVWHGFQQRARAWMADIKPAELALRDENGQPFTWTSPDNHRALYNILPWGYGRPDVMIDMADTINALIDELGPDATLADLLPRLPLNDRETRALAVAYTQPFEGNGYFNQPVVLKLLTVGLLKRLDDVVSLGDRPAMNRPTVSVMYGMFYGVHCYETVLWMKPLLEDKPRELLEEAMTTIADRAAFSYPIMHNAAAHVPLVLELAAQFNDDPWSRELADRYLDRFLTGAWGFDHGVTPSGGIAEYQGYGGQYDGYSWAPFARLYLNTGSERVLEALRRGFELHRHTSLPVIARSPNSWASRTAGVFQDWASAATYMPELVPAMALFASTAPTGFVRTSPPPLRDDVEPLISPRSLTFAYVDRRELPSAQFAAEEPGPFTRNVNDGDEWFAFRREGYYALVFAGRLAPPFWNDCWGGYAGLGGGNLTAIFRPNAGPVSVSKKTGSAAYGEAYDQWDQTVLHDVAGEMASGQEIRLADSMPATTELDGDTLTIAGTGRNAPISYHRTYRFSDRRIDITLALKGDGLGEGLLFRAPKPMVASLQEILPFEDHQTGAEAFDAEGQSLGKVGDAWIANVSAVQIGQPGQGMRITFSEPQAVKVGKSLWIRLIDEPMPLPGKIADLAYTIHLPAGD